MAFEYLKERLKGFTLGSREVTRWSPFAAKARAIVDVSVENGRRLDAEASIVSAQVTERVLQCVTELRRQLDAEMVPPPEIFSASEIERVSNAHGPDQAVVCGDVVWRLARNPEDLKEFLSHFDAPVRMALFGPLSKLGSEIAEGTRLSNEAKVSRLRALAVRRLEREVVENDFPVDVGLMLDRIESARNPIEMQVVLQEVVVLRNEGLAREIPGADAEAAPKAF